MIDCGGWDKPARADVVGLVVADHRVLAVHIVSLDCAANDKVVTAPAVVGAVAVAGEGTAEVGGGEGCNLVADAGGDH